MIPSNRLGCAGNNDETMEKLYHAGDVRDERKADAKAAKTRNAIRKQQALVTAEINYQQFLRKLQTLPPGAEITLSLFNLPGTHIIQSPNHHSPPLTYDAHTCSSEGGVHET